MKILLTVDPEIEVPPANYGGIERIVDGLAKEYAAHGHEVFLLANPASTCKYTNGNYGWPALRSGGAINILKNASMLRRVHNEIRPDIIHSFSRLLYGYPLFLFSNTPFVQSYQRKISARSTSWARKVADGKLRFTSCAAHMISRLPDKSVFTPVFNFTDTDYFFEDATTTRDSLLFLGRIEDIKGTEEAILAAIGAREKIIVAGNIQNGHEQYFERSIKPLLTHPDVSYVGPVNDEQKRRYLQQAKAMLFPIKWEEPFGIVLAEAMACGTPVIAFNRGSVPEVVVDGQTGFVCETLDEMTKRIADLPAINNQEVRRYAVSKFSSKVIAEEYLALFGNMVTIKKASYE